MQNISEIRTKPTNGTREMIFNQNNHPISHFTKLSNMEMKCEGDLQHAIHNEGDGPGFSLLNMDLPIYMNCPHCKTSARSKKKHSLKFASTVSQLQRIFLV
jgi:protein SMG8